MLFQSTGQSKLSPCIHGLLRSSSQDHVPFQRSVMPSARVSFYLLAALCSFVPSPRALHSHDPRNAHQIVVKQRKRGIVWTVLAADSALWARQGLPDAGGWFCKGNRIVGTNGRPCMLLSRIPGLIIDEPRRRGDASWRKRTLPLRRTSSMSWSRHCSRSGSLHSRA